MELNNSQSERGQNENSETDDVNERQAATTLLRLRLCRDNGPLTEDTLFTIEFQENDNVDTVLRLVREGTRRVIAREAVRAHEKNAPHNERQTPCLSVREAEVLSVIARGFTYQEAAALLNVAQETINVHLRNAYRKLGVHSKTEAVFEASRHGMIQL